MPSDSLTLFATDLFVPRYRPMRSGDWELRCGANVLCPGYWGDVSLVLDIAALTRGHETWMSMTPMEIESQEIGCRLARGYTVVMGMGMGWAAANAALMPEVSRVTVVEYDPDVLAFHAECDVFAQLPPEAAAKVEIMQGDALHWLPDAPVDTLLADIWLPLNGDDRVDEVRRMQANTGADHVYFWGQEMVIARRARALGGALDADTVAAIVRELELPLLGPSLPDYPNRIARAAAAHLRD
ncbi:hypothetical protein [Sphingomonas hengshuiensis]|uniref:Spermidine synthase n=1 Tax=Sphingomonas hengshuiensis TaxID=1609977 RepID=A0A7U4LG17_9SPHN|nr:hypothetical protein [Sphingomonas hengshuiensis]AJP72838.1 hypothetical protein TS85_15205 [Sphingomonas hengshuiensis]